MPVFQIPYTRISLVLLVHSYSAVLSFQFGNSIKLDVHPSRVSASGNCLLHLDDLFIYFYFCDFRDGVTQIFIVNSHNKIQGKKNYFQRQLFLLFLPFKSLDDCLHQQIQDTGINKHLLTFSQVCRVPSTVIRVGITDKKEQTKLKHPSLSWVNSAITAT